MADGEASLSQSRLDDFGATSLYSQTSLGSKPPRPSVSGMDATDLDPSASIAFSDLASERASRPRSEAAPRRTSSSNGNHRPTSNSNLGTSFLKDEADGDEGASVHGSEVAPSERLGKPRSSPTPSQWSPSATSNRGAGGGSRLASETNFAFGDGDDVSIAGSDRPSKPRTSPAPSQRPPTHSSDGRGSRRLSESSMGLGISMPADETADMSIGGSERTSKPRSSPAPTNRPPSITSNRGGGGSRLGSESNLGFSGFSLQGKEAEDDDASTRAASERGDRSASRAHSAASGGPSRGSRKTSSANGDAVADGDPNATSMAYSEAFSEPYAKESQAASASRKASEASGGRSARGSAASGLHEEESAATPTRRRSFASSLRQSVASNKAASAAGDGSDEYSEDAAYASNSVSRQQSKAGDDAASVRSGASAVSARSRNTTSGRNGGGSAAGSVLAKSESVRSAHSGTSLNRTAGVAKSKTSDPDGYSEEGFDEEVVEDASEEEDEGQPLNEPVESQEQSQEQEEAVKSMTSSEVVPAAASTGSRGSVTSRRQSTASGRPPSATSRHSTARSASGSGSTKGGHTPAARESGSGSAVLSGAGASVPAGYSGEYVDTVDTLTSSLSAPAKAASVTDHGPIDGPASPAGSAMSVARSIAASSIAAMPASAAAAAGHASVSGSIFQVPPSDAGRSRRAASSTSGSVFRRLPADAPDSPMDAAEGAASADGRPPLRTGSSRSGAGAGAGADGNEWNEGAIRVTAPGVHRISEVRSAGTTGEGTGLSTRPRPMSAAPRDRQAALLDGLIRKHPATWDNTDVATWVEFLGLGQYRRRFLHHCIDGRLLLRMTDAQLKSDLGIGPIGHRVAILEAAANLIKNYKEAEKDRALASAGEGEAEGDGGDGRQEYTRPSTAPRSRPFSALGGALTMNISGPRRPTSASRSVIPPDPFLGPAMGKVTVYEQRSKLLFELDRAQARAEQHRVLAEQLRHTATLSSEEVSHIRGLLMEIELKNRQAFGLSAPADPTARVPWRHVGRGSKFNLHPERFARPGEPDTVDLTFQPRCTNPESRKLMGGGEYGEHSSAVASFLDRLNNDLRKREQTRKDLERRYYSDGSGNPAAQVDADFAFVGEQLQARFQVIMERDPESYEPLIDQALDKLCTTETWRDAALRDGPIRAAKGPAKLAATASALRAVSFLERYRSDLQSKTTKMKALEKKWIDQTLGSQYLPGGKDKEDLEEGAKFFALLGWRDSDGNASEDAVESDLLDKLLDRAMEFRKRYDVWWERARDKPEDRAAGFKCDINWFSAPWDTDGLGQQMAREMKRMGDAPSAPGGSMDFVEFTVRLLGRCRQDDLRRLQSLQARPKRLGVYRAIRTQKFIEFTQKDLEERERKLRQAYESFAPSRRKLPSSRIENFFERLLDDAAKRRAKAEKAAHDKVLKEQEILSSSIMYGRARSAR